MAYNLEARIFSNIEEPIKTMWLAARNCYYRENFRSLEKLYPGNKKAAELLKKVYNSGHTSILEFAGFSFEVENFSRSALAQLTRHRVGFSFAVQSQHYQNYKNFHYKELEKYSNPEQRRDYIELMKKINSFYKSAVKDKLPIYIAREVLPNACLVHLMLGANLRALDNFWKLRKTPNNTPEIIKLSSKLYKAVTDKFPEIKDIIPY
jgi:thymidylate synthase (FAD)